MSADSDDPFAKELRSDARPDPANQVFDYLSPPKGPDELGWLGSYRVVKRLGQGGMGTVFEAIDIHLQRPVALKVMNPDVGRNLEFRQRFIREARATAAVKSDYIVTIHQVGEQNDVLFLAMELLHGEPLDCWLALRGQPSVPECLRLGAEMANGLAAAHSKGHIHRDIKPANIWIEHPGDRVKILDFGMTRPTGSEARLTQAGLVLGTPGYMAPEQAEGADVDERADLFSLGCVLYELASREKAFDGPSHMSILKAVALQEPEPLEQINPGLPPAFVNLVTALLKKNPADRPSSARDVAETLEAIAQEVPGAAQSGKFSGRLKRWTSATESRRRRNAAGVAVLAGVLLLGGLYFGGSFSRSDPRTGGAAARPQSTAQGVTDTEIILGMSAPFSGPTQELGRGMRAGILAYISSINDQGGVAGRKLKLISLDDGYEPERALANMKELDEKYKVFAFIGNVGTPTAEVTMPYAAGRKMLFFGAFTGAGILREEPPNRYVFNYRASYAEETEKTVQYLMDIRKVKPEEIAVFAQNDDFGDSGFEGVARALRTKGRHKDQILRAGYPRNTLDVDAAVAAILKHPEIRAVVMVPTYRPAAKFIQKLRDAGRTELVFTNVSFVNGRALADELMQLGPRYAEGVIVTQVVPHPEAGSSIALQCEEQFRRYQPDEKPGFTSLEGYIAAMLFVQGLQRIGDRLDTETLVSALESIADLDLGLGTKLSFGPSDHQASHRVWGTELDKSGRYTILRDMDDALMPLERK